MPSMENLRRQGLIWVLLCAAISIVWGTWFAQSGNAWIDFRAVYAGTRCLMHRHNPYEVRDLAREYGAEDGQRPPATPLHIQSITLYVNMPTTFMIVAPFAALPWEPAHILWMLFTGCVFVLALLLMWRVGAQYAPRVSTILICVLAFNCESIFGGGNTAGMVVGLCGIAVWCFLKGRWVRIGILCLAVSLAVKPHDAGLVWLYFVLAGGANRKRALQSVLVTAIIGVAAAVWVSHVAPTWVHDWRANLATISAPGGINDPGPDAVKDGSLYSIVDLQAAVSIFCDFPRLYNAATYLLCGVLVLLWSLWTLRTEFSDPNAWLALPVAATLSLLITYHRLWDAKLVMLAVPGCCLLWAEGGRTAKAAMLITSTAILATGEISLVILEAIVATFHPSKTWTAGPLITAALIRPAPLALLVMAIFYLLAYVEHGRQLRASPSSVGTCIGRRYELGR